MARRILTTTAMVGAFLAGVVLAGGALAQGGPPPGGDGGPGDGGAPNRVTDQPIPPGAQNSAATDLEAQIAAAVNMLPAGASKDDIAQAIAGVLTMMGVDASTAQTALANYNAAPTTSAAAKSAGQAAQLVVEVAASTGTTSLSNFSATSFSSATTTAISNNTFTTLSSGGSANAGASFTVAAVGAANGGTASGQYQVSVSSTSGSAGGVAAASGLASIANTLTGTTSYVG